MINFDWLRAREPPPEFDREFISTRPERVAEKIHDQRANLYQFATAQTYTNTQAPTTATGKALFYRLTPHSEAPICL